MIQNFIILEKKLFKNDRLISTKSYLTLNRLLKNLFEEKKINFLIQIGANDGLSFDELNFFIKKYKTKSLLVEPIEENFNLLKENYKNLDFITFENSAISVNEEIAYLYKVDSRHIQEYGPHIPAIPSFDKKHLINHGVKNQHIVSEKVNSITILDLINKHKFNNLDLNLKYNKYILLVFLGSTLFKFLFIESHIFKNV